LSAEGTTRSQPGNGNPALEDRHFRLSRPFRLSRSSTSAATIAAAASFTGALLGARSEAAAGSTGQAFRSVEKHAFCSPRIRRIFARACLSSTLVARRPMGYSPKRAGDVDGFRRAPQAVREWSELYGKLQRRTLVDCWPLWRGAHNQYCNVCISANGRFLLSGQYRMLKLWVAATGRCLSSFESGGVLSAQPTRKTAVV
jgi:hypothetical protein